MKFPSGFAIISDRNMNPETSFRDHAYEFISLRGMARMNFVYIKREKSNSYITIKDRSAISGELTEEEFQHHLEFINSQNY